MVMVRPRPGNFNYTALEFESMLADIQAIRDAGAQGVVLGVLQADMTIDVARTNQLVLAARPMLVTFHRAFDLTPDPYAALEQLVEAGVDRVLTSGQAVTAVEGLACIRKLVKQSDGRLTVLAGGGIRPQNVESLISQGGLQEIHSSAFRPQLSVGESDQAKNVVGGTGDEQNAQLDTKKIKRMVEALNRFR
jgi:copper homeostasis protein